MAEGRHETKTCPPEPYLLQTTSINLTSGHSRRHLVDAIKSSKASLFEQRQKPSPKRGKERGALSSSRRKMESSDSREHVAEDEEQPQRVTVLGL